MEEIWKSIDGYEGIYEISNMGRCRSLDRKDCRGRFCKGQYLILTKNRLGYLKIGLSRNRITKSTSVHRLVAIAFIPNPNNLPQVNHKDGDKSNNHVNNLEWTDNSGNQLHAYANNLHISKVGETHYNFNAPILVFDQNSNLVDRLIGAKDMKEKGYIHSNIYKCLNGKRKSHRGCTFEREILNNKTTEYERN